MVCDGETEAEGQPMHDTPIVPISVQRQDQGASPLENDLKVGLTINCHDVELFLTSLRPLPLKFVPWQPSYEASMPN